MYDFLGKWQFKQPPSNVALPGFLNLQKINKSFFYYSAIMQSFYPCKYLSCLSVAYGHLFNRIVHPSCAWVMWISSPSLFTIICTKQISSPIPCPNPEPAVSTCPRSRCALRGGSEVSQPLHSWQEALNPSPRNNSLMKGQAGGN